MLYRLYVVVAVVVDVVHWRKAQLTLLELECVCILCAVVDAFICTYLVIYMYVGMYISGVYTLRDTCITCCLYTFRYCFIVWAYLSLFCFAFIIFIHTQINI